MTGYRESIWSVVGDCDAGQGEDRRQAGRQWSIHVIIFGRRGIGCRC